MNMSILLLYLYYTQSSAKNHNASPDKQVLLYLIVCTSKLIYTIFFFFNITQ